MELAEYKRQAVLGSAIAAIVALSVIAGVLYLPSGTTTTLTSTAGTSSTSVISSGSCASPYPTNSPPDTSTSFKNGTTIQTTWLPILALTQAGSTGQICVKYSNGNYSGTPDTSVYQLDNYNSSVTSLVTLKSNPASVYVNNQHPSQLVTYNLNSTVGSKGIYAIPLFHQALAVGYQASQLSFSNFTWYSEWNICTGICSLTTSIVGLTNVKVLYLPIVTTTTYDFNITSLSVYSFSPQPNQENITFTLGIQTFGSAVDASYDAAQSRLTVLSSDPGLRRLLGGSWCEFVPTNSVNGQQFYYLTPYSPPQNNSLLPSSTSEQHFGNITVVSNSIQIQPDSFGTYSISILFANMSQGYYYYFNLNAYILKSSIPSGGGAGITTIATAFPVPLAGNANYFSGNRSGLLSFTCT